MPRFAVLILRVRVQLSPTGITLGLFLLDTVPTSGTHETAHRGRSRDALHECPDVYLFYRRSLGRLAVVHRRCSMMLDWPAHI